MCHSKEYKSYILEISKTVLIWKVYVQVFRELVGMNSGL